MSHSGHHGFGRILACGVALALTSTLGATGQDRQDRHVCTVTAHKYAFVVDGKDGPAVIEVKQDELVQITFTAEDIAHSFTIDAYRIAKRGEPGKPVTFEFRADKAGKFRFYCNLTIDDGCKKMAGELVVKPPSSWK
jgi:heme/copper-type cytochrome/quinol oxidase subunit 2